MDCSFQAAALVSLWKVASRRSIFRTEGIKKSYTTPYANHVTPPDPAFPPPICMWMLALDCLLTEEFSEESDRPGRARTGPSDEPLHAADEAHRRDKYLLTVIISPRQTEQLPGWVKAEKSFL